MLQVISLIGTGIVLGIVHVLTGPDHLSALATLSANVDNIQQSTLLGIRWGIGHSTGLLLVAIILILFDHQQYSNNNNNNNNESTTTTTTIQVPKTVSIFFESIVGIFLIVLGCHGIRRAIVKRSDMYRVIPSAIVTTQPTNDTFEQQQQQHEHVHDSNTFLSIYHGNRITASPISSIENDIEMLHHTNETIQSQQQQQLQHSSSAASSSSSSSTATCCRKFVLWTSNLSTRSMALVAGIVHGLAGPGGVLGVIPAIQLHNGTLAAIYLFTFCVTSTITMGIFAAIYGSCSSSLRTLGGLQYQQQYQSQDHEVIIAVDRPYLTDCTLASPRIREFRIEVASSCLSIFVGIMWLILLAVGKLDEIFP